MITGGYSTCIHYKNCTWNPCVALGLDWVKKGQGWSVFPIPVSSWCCHVVLAGSWWLADFLVCVLWPGHHHCPWSPGRGDGVIFWLCLPSPCQEQPLGPVWQQSAEDTVHTHKIFLLHSFPSLFLSLIKKSIGSQTLVLQECAVSS